MSARVRARLASAAWLAVASCLALGSIGCAGTQVYERGRLAKAKMQFGVEPEADKLEQHVYEYREGASGGYGTPGGGCGCN